MLLNTDCLNRQIFPPRDTSYYEGTILKSGIETIVSVNKEPIAINIDYGAYNHPKSYRPSASVINTIVCSLNNGLLPDRVILLIKSVLENGGCVIPQEAMLIKSSMSASDFTCSKQYRIDDYIINFTSLPNTFYNVGRPNYNDDHLISNGDFVRSFKGRQTIDYTPTNKPIPYSVNTETFKLIKLLRKIHKKPIKEIFYKLSDFYIKSLNKNVDKIEIINYNTFIDKVGVTRFSYDKFIHKLNIIKTDCPHLGKWLTYVFKLNLGENK